MINRLVIDDVRKIPAHDDVVTTYARSIKKARRLLNKQDWDEVWFDFDMGHGKTTLGLAYDIERGKINADNIGLAVIHTANPLGRWQLQNCLHDVVQVKHVDVGGFKRGR